MDRLGYQVWRTFPPEEIPSSLSLVRDFFGSFEPGNLIVDLGCGTGATCFELSEEGYRHVVGVDINERAIQRAHVRAQAFETPPMFVVGDACVLPLADNIFDSVILKATLTTVPDPDDRIRILMEAYRILRPGGTLLIMEFGQTWHSARYRDRYLSGFRETGLEATFPVINEASQEVRYYAHHFSMREISEMLISANFEICSFRYEYPGFLTSTGHMVDGIVIIAKK